jgi:hypothetical protein
METFGWKFGFQLSEDFNGLLLLTFTTSKTKVDCLEEA